MSSLHHRVSEKLTEMQHVFPEDLLHLRGKIGQIVPKRSWPVMRWQCPTCRTEIHALTTDVKNKQLLRALLTCTEIKLTRTNE